MAGRVFHSSVSPERAAQMNAFFDECDRKLALPLSAGPETDVMLMDYHSVYLPSKLWAKIRRRVLKRDQKVCQSCGGRGSLVHHRSYERDVLEGKADHMLATVCEGSHDRIHFDDHGLKRPEGEWDAVFLAGQHQIEFPEPTIDLRLKTQPRPNGWGRMTARQKGRWTHRVNVLICEKHIAKGHAHWDRTLQELLATQPE